MLSVLLKAYPEPPSRMLSVLLKAYPEAPLPDALRA
jgi:hypothetical protein